MVRRPASKEPRVVKQRKGKSQKPKSPVVAEVQKNLPLSKEIKDKKIDK